MLSSFSWFRKKWVIVIAGLIVLRASLPLFIKSYVNYTLDKHPSYDGHVDEIDLSLLRGAYRIVGLRIEKTEGDVPTPLFSSNEIDLSVQWKEIWRNRSVVGEVVLINPQINIVDSSEKKNEQLGAEKTTDDVGWLQISDDLFPLKINRLEVHAGAIHFRNFDDDPPVDIYLSQVEGTVTNISNTKRLAERLVASLTAHGNILKSGRFDIAVEFDPFATTPTLDLNASFHHVDLVEMNDFLRHYLDIDVEKGQITFYVEAVSQEGRFEGYVKPFIKDLNVLASKREKMPLGKKVKEWAIDVAATIFKNSRTETVASKIPFSGKYEETDVRTWSAIGFLFRHAFIQALQSHLDRSIRWKRSNG